MPHKAYFTICASYSSLMCDYVHVINILYYYYYYYNAAAICHSSLNNISLYRSFPFLFISLPTGISHTMFPYTRGFPWITAEICSSLVTQYSPTVLPAGFFSPFFTSSPFGNDTINWSGSLINKPVKARDEAMATFSSTEGKTVVITSWNKNY